MHEQGVAAAPYTAEPLPFSRGLFLHFLISTTQPTHQIGIQRVVDCMQRGAMESPVVVHPAPHPVKGVGAWWQSVLPLRAIGCSFPQPLSSFVWIEFSALVRIISPAKEPLAFPKIERELR